LRANPIESYKKKKKKTKVTKKRIKPEKITKQKLKNKITKI
jgi:hypothetical protein